MVDRRKFLQTTATLAAAAASMPVFNAQAQGRPITLTVSGISPPDNPNSVLFKRYLDRLEKASNGRLKLNWHPGAVLVPSNQALDALGSGSIDMLLSQPSFYAGKVSIGSFTELPYFRPSYSSVADLFYKTDILNIVDSVYREKTNTTVIQARPFPPYT